jgi:hypothetical protein
MRQKLIVLLVLVCTVCCANAQSHQVENIQLAEPTHEDPVSVGATIINGEKEDEKVIVMKTRIKDGYHIYAYVPQSEAYIKTEQGIELPVGVELLGDWDKSAPAPYPGNSQLLVYKKENSFKHKIKVGADVARGTSIKCWLYYQCCNASICLPPKKKEFELEL